MLPIWFLSNFSYKLLCLIIKTVLMVCKFYSGVK
ncbi:UNVERIFIED_CONTAM: hypothetical protein NCL1_44371 [Trichonephila clavipes]